MIRPLRAEDAGAAADVIVRALLSDRSGADAWRRIMRRRTERLAVQDPDGAWAAEEDGAIVGVTLAVVREGVWVLTMLAVDPGAQSGGLGRELMGRALAYGEGCHAGLIAASDDPRALRLYARSGHALRPALSARGKVNRPALPDGLRVREGSADDIEETAAIDRAVRGAARTQDLAAMLADNDSRRLLLTGDGYALGDGGRVLALAARSEESAQALLWSVLADTPGGEEAEVMWLTAGQDWAVDVVLRAGLSLKPEGTICVRGNPGPLRPFVPSGAFL